MRKHKIGFMAIALFVATAGTAVVLQTAMANGQDKIEYNVVYECGEGKAKFKVLSCAGPGKFDRCETFAINELSPGGGFKGSSTRGTLEDYYLGREGCKVKDRVGVRVEKVRPESEAPVSRNDRTLRQGKPEAEVGCDASSRDSDGKTANERTFRGVIRRLWEKEAPEGSDGAVTISFENLLVGASRPWRPTATDAYSQADPRKPIFAVRTTFETCTDYRAAISKRKMERVYDCFVHKAGGWQCTQTGASGALALKDKKQYIQKRRQ